MTNSEIPFEMDPKKIEETIAGIKKMREVRDLQEQNLPLLKTLYPNQWIAISNGNILGPCETYYEALDILTKAGDPKSAIISHLNPHPPTLIL